MRSETTFPLSPLLAVSALQICGASLDNDRSFSGRTSQGSPGSFELDERKNKQPRLEIGRTKLARKETTFFNQIQETPRRNLRRNGPGFGYYGVSGLPIDSVKEV